MRIYVENFPPDFRISGFRDRKKVRTSDGSVHTSAPNTRIIFRYVDHASEVTIDMKPHITTMCILFDVCLLFVCNLHNSIFNQGHRIA